MNVMSLRISSALILAGLVAACGPESQPPEGDEIECAIGSGASYSKVCTLERVSKDGSATFLIHAPDGSFRRLLIDPESGDFGSVDGADELEILSQDGEMAEFSIAEDRYRIPHRLVRKPVE